MKITFMILLIPVIIAFISHGNNLTAISKKQFLAPIPTIIDNSIVGTWKLTMEAYDENFNKTLDDEERKMGMKNSTPQALHDYQMQFNANGTCKIERLYNGTYKLNEESDKKILTVNLEATEGANKKQLPASRHKYHIISMSSSELLLLAEVSGVTYTFWLFKKL